MNDLISRQAAIDALDSINCCGYVEESWDTVRNIIERVPAAQPEIIRCKDCKNSEHWYRDKRRCFLWAEDGIGVFDDGFCSYAERKENE